MATELVSAARIRSYRALRREMGEKNASTAIDDTGDFNAQFFDIKRPRLKYPEEFDKHPQNVKTNPNDPYAHLGRVGYTRNTFQFRGVNKDENNIYGGQHMKKTAWLEEMRRRIIAENQGISADVDDTCISGTGQAFYLKTREKKNTYYQANKTAVWNSQTPNLTSLKTVKT